MEDSFRCILEQPDHEKPLVLVLVGPNGSGKSSLANLLGLTSVQIGDKRYKGRIVFDGETGEVLLPMVNPDEIAKAIKHDNPSMNWDACNLQAAREADETRKVLAEAGFDFCFETVGSHVSKVEFLAGLKSKGYTIAILFISTENPEINVRRVKERHHSGGHDVPPEKVRSRYLRTMRLLPEYYLLADVMAIFDNGDDREQNDGKGPKLLLIKRRDGVTITDNGRQSPWLIEHIDRMF